MDKPDSVCFVCTCLGWVQRTLVGHCVRIEKQARENKVDRTWKLA